MLNGNRNVLRQVGESGDLLEPLNRKCLSHNVLRRLGQGVRELDYPDKST